MSQSFSEFKADQSQKVKGLTDGRGDSRLRAKDTLKPYYQHAGITIYHGDCREILPKLRFELVITDPPYGCSATTGRGGIYDSFSIHGDNSTELRDWLISTIRTPWVVFGSPRIPRPACKSVLIWSKGEHTG